MERWEFSTDGTFIYTPNTGYFGPDSFVYQAVDSLGAMSNEAMVEIIVKSINDAPVLIVPGQQMAQPNTLVFFRRESEPHLGHRRGRGRRFDSG